MKYDMHVTFLVRKNGQIGIDSSICSQSKNFEAQKLGEVMSSFSLFIINLIWLHWVLLGQVMPLILILQLPKMSVRVITHNLEIQNFLFTPIINWKFYSCNNCCSLSCGTNSLKKTQKKKAEKKNSSHKNNIVLHIMLIDKTLETKSSLNWGIK